jgi:thioredoxin 1
VTSLASITDATFDETVLTAGKTIVVDFWAEWCPPCRAVEPVLEQIAAEHPDSLTVVRINADENTESVIAYGALSLPTMKVFSGGAVVATIVGAKSKAALEAALAPHLG